MQEKINLFKKELMFEYGEDVTSKLFQYLDFILEKNEHINLTAVKNRNEGIVKHIADSLAIAKLDEYYHAEKIMDVGTGAGFPGALLSIISPEKKFVLVDSTLKKLRVIKEATEKIGIGNIELVHARAEELRKKEEYSGKFDIVTSRAVANLELNAKWALPFVKKGGNFIAYKGENYQKEIDAAQKSLKKAGATIKKIVPIAADFDEISGHRLIVIHK